jgi:hypothetical protein
MLYVKTNRQATYRGSQEWMEPLHLHNFLPNLFEIRYQDPDIYYESEVFKGLSYLKHAWQVD